MIYVDDLIVGDVGCDDYENVACLDYHIKLGTTLIFFCFWRDCWEIVSIVKIGMGEMDSPHRVGQPAHCQYCHL